MVSSSDNSDQRILKKKQMALLYLGVLTYSTIASIKKQHNFMSLIVSMALISLILILVQLQKLQLFDKISHFVIILSATFHLLMLDSKIFVSSAPYAFFVCQT